MKVGDIVEYFPHFYKKRTGVYIGVIVQVMPNNMYNVEYTLLSDDGRLTTWVDLEHKDTIVKLTKLELALR